MRFLLFVFTIFLVLGTSFSYGAHPYRRPELCVKEACKQVGSLRCNEKSEITRARKYCRLNYSGACLQVACYLVGGLKCNSHDEVQQLALACSDNYDGQCVRLTCKQLGRLACNSIPEVVEVAVSCQVPPPEEDNDDTQTF